MVSRIKEITVYDSIDGVEFSNEYECKEHEERVLYKKVVTQGVPTITYEEI